MPSGELQRRVEPPSHPALEETLVSSFSPGANAKHPSYGSAVGFPSYGTLHNQASARVVRLRFTPDEGWEVAA
jgi:hypothetical protein